MVLLSHSKKRIRLSRSFPALCICATLGISGALHLSAALAPSTKWAFKPVAVTLLTRPEEGAVAPLVAPERAARVPQVEVLPLDGGRAREIPKSGGQPGDAMESVRPEEARGGSLLVLELVIGHDQIVRDARILVPSKYELEDFTFVMAARGSVWPEPLPELTPGATVVREYRIRYANSDDDFLP